MDDADLTQPAKRLSRTEASQAISSLGWRYLLDTLCCSVPVGSLADAVQLAGRLHSACGARADEHLRLDLRPHRVELSLQTRSLAAVTDRDVQLAERLTAVLADSSMSPAGATSSELARPVQMLEIAIDAMDIPAIRPFWKAVLAYADEPGRDGPDDAIVDPAGQLPTVWFQQQDQPRPQRNRIHFDITVAHDEALGRLRAALDAGGVLLDDSAARSFWILADVEGNEICICSWQDRDPVPASPEVTTADGS
jgi:4a-hydroxytetrahydrobiopterin dehydratase